MHFMNALFRKRPSSEDNKRDALFYDSASRFLFSWLEAIGKFRLRGHI